MSELDVVVYAVAIAALTYSLGYLVIDAFERWVAPRFPTRRARRAERERRAEAIRRVAATRRPDAVVADRGPAPEPRELCSICTERPAVVWLHLVPESQDQLARWRVCLECHRVVRRSWAIASDVRRFLAQHAGLGLDEDQPGGAR